MTQPQKNHGKHYLVDFIDCDKERLKFAADVKEAFLEAAVKSEATILEHYFYQFDPIGVTGIILIAESHFAIHTWPEDGFAAFDILTCGQMYPERAIEALKETFSAKEVNTKLITRGTGNRKEQS